MHTVLKQYSCNQSRSNIKSRGHGPENIFSLVLFSSYFIFRDFGTPMITKIIKNFFGCLHKNSVKDVINLPTLHIFSGHNFTAHPLIKAFTRNHVGLRKISARQQRHQLSLLHVLSGSVAHNF